MSRPLENMADQGDDLGASEPSHDLEAEEAEGKYPGWVRLGILGAGVIVSWALIVLIVMALIRD